MDEVDGTSGVAHVLEHMMFKGTDTLAPGEFSRRVAALGGRENAFTARDYTGYYQQIPANRLEDVMKLEADRFANNRGPTSNSPARSRWSRKSAACAPRTTRARCCTRR
jgi:zinc protease